MLGISNLSLSIGNSQVTSSGGGGTSTATLTTGISTTGAGVNRSKWVNATSFQAVLNANVGQACLVRANTAAANSKFQVEATLAYGGAGNTIYIGFDDSTTDVSNAGTGWIPQSKEPGNAAGGPAAPGFLLELTQGLTAPAYAANGTRSNITTTALDNGQVITLDVDTVANTVLIKQNGTTIQTITLTSQIPSSWWFLLGGVNGNGTAGAGSSDSPTVNFGGSAWNSAPPGGFSYYA